MTPEQRRLIDELAVAARRMRAVRARAELGGPPPDPASARQVLGDLPKVRALVDTMLDMVPGDAALLEARAELDASERFFTDCTLD